MATIEGMDILASIALLLFMGIFLYVSYYSFFVMSKDTAEEISEIPLHDSNEV